jgi:hypothetical protein
MAYDISSEAGGIRKTMSKCPLSVVLSVSSKKVSKNG